MVIFFDTPKLSLPNPAHLHNSINGNEYSAKGLYNEKIRSFGADLEAFLVMFRYEKPYKNVLL
jgi:hypothetical protein